MAGDGGMIERKEIKAPEHISVRIDYPEGDVGGYIGMAYTGKPHSLAVTYTRAHTPYQEVDAIQDELEL